ncbi:hypothetical protein [Geminicoccus roseus]|uniref:hypothetical protein n=1 Tax=Geminicoccus roseus TaxID=404900 RepID=UPI0012FAC2AB|nr:hypothetical protein [Geminicoccus roseus]
MTNKNVSLGATIVHQYYPSFIDLPVGRYLVDSDDLKGMIEVLEHVRPLVITDFSNAIINRPEKKGKIFSDIKRPIHRISRDSIAADAVGNEGRVALAIVLEKPVNGRVFYHDAYTSLLIVSEFGHDKTPDDISFHQPLLKRFIGTYRCVTSDLRTSFFEGAPDAVNAVRIGHRYYTDKERDVPFQERLLAIDTDVDLRPCLLGLGKGARGLQDHYDDEAKTTEKGHHIGKYLIDGFKPPENIIEIEKLANLAFNDEKLRPAVAEAMSILEISILSHQRKFKRFLNISKQNEEKEVTWKFLMNGMLASLLDLYEHNGSKGKVIKNANWVLDVRHKVVHDGYNPSKDEVDRVLSFAKTLITIFEMPEDYKGNWKLKEQYK